jgi:putative ABC transport system permease protein
MRNFRHDLVHATRRLARSPLYTVFAVLTLAVGIAATTSLYSLLSFVLWRPDAVVNPERVVELKGDTVVPGRSGVPGRFSWPDWQSLAEQQQSFSHVAAVGRLVVSIFNEGAASMALGEGVTGDYFAMVGVPPLHGRLLSRADSAPDAPLVVVLSARTARAQFRDEARAVGQMLTISGQRAEVVGVVTDNLFGIGAAFMPATFWLPLEHSRAMPGISPAYFDPARRDARWLIVRGRLRDDVTLSRAAEELALIGRRVEVAFPSIGVTTAVAAGTPSGRNWRAEPVSTREAETFSRVGVAMMVGVMLALLMVCANLANLGLSRSAARQPEFAVRRALGASRWRIAREQLVECGLVVAMGTVVALVATRWLITIMQVDVPIATGMTMSLQPEVTWPVAAMAAGASVLSMLFVGVGPAWRSAGADIRPLMAQEGATTPTRWRTQRRLVAVQVAGSVALLLLALSVAQSVTHGTRAPGVDVNQLAVASVNFFLSPREVSQIDRLRDDVLQRVRQSPGVETAAAATSLPFGLGSSQGGVAPTDTELAANGGANAYFISGTADLLPALGIPMVSGRTFSDDEVRETRPVIVLSETIARALFGSTDVIGRVAWFRRSTPTKGVPERFTVIGVSRDTDTFAMGARPSGAVFLPLARDSGNQLVFVARTAGDPAAMAGVLRRSIREVDPSLTIDIAGTGWSVLSGRYFFMAALAWVASALGLLTLVLVMTGLFGVLSAVVTQQTREFGIRMALGSTSADLLRLVVRQGLRPARDGLIIGLAIGILSRVALGAILPSGLAVIDVFAFIVVPIVIVGTAVASSIIPARRAAAVDPNVALRTN